MLKSKWGRLAAILGGVVVVCALVALAITLVFGNGDTICKGVSVSGIDIGGMPKAKAASAVRQWAHERVHRNITLTALERRWSGTLASLGLRIDWQGSVDRAFLVGRKGSILNRAICVLTSGGSGKHIAATRLIDPTQLGRTLTKVAETVNRPHEDARLVVVDGRLQVRQDSSGIKLDKEAATDVVARAAGSGRNFVQLPIVTDPPEITSQDCAGINTLLSSFTTPFNAGKRGRTHNLTLGARAISGRIVMPSQVFSCNDTIGPRLEGTGFQMAQVYIKGELVDGIGGGICQVSSTLFNAVLLAGLKVIERSPHPETVPYVAAGRDATVAYGHKDFRFQNTSTMPIGIVTMVRGSHLTVQVYGSAQDKKAVKIFSGKLRRMAAGSKTVVDATLAPGARKVVEKGVRGGDVVLYRKMVGPDGKDIIDAFHSRYAPHKAVIAVGTTPTVASE